MGKTKCAFEMILLFVFVLSLEFGHGLDEKTKFGHPEERSGQFQGDILIHPTQRNGLSDLNTRWPGGVLPFVIDPTFSKTVQVIKSNDQLLSFWT